MSQVNIDNAWYEVPDPVMKRMREYYNAMTEACNRYDELRAAVQDARDKQKLYFKNTKAFNLLDDAKAAEKVLDAILSGKQKQVISEQKALF